TPPPPRGFSHYTRQPALWSPPMFRPLLAAGVLGLIALGLPAAEPIASLPDLSEYKTVDKAIPAQNVKPKVAPLAQPALLGVHVETRKDAEGVVIKQVTPGSAAERARLKTEEVILKIDDVVVPGPDKLKDFLATKKPDDVVTLTLLLAEKPVEMKVTLGSE